MKKALFAAALAASSALAVTSISAQNAPSLPGVADISRVSAGTYATDPAHTLVGWRLNHFGFNDYFGIFGEVEGTLELDPANPEAAKLDVTIPITSVAVASDGLKSHLLRPGKDGGDPDFFGSDPEAARFVSTQVIRTGDTSAQIVGDLTLNGVTRPVAIAATFTGAGANPMSKAQTIGFEGRAVLNRSDFGISTYVPLVSDQVELELTAAFEKQ